MLSGIKKATLTYLIIFWLHFVAYEILVPQPGTEPMPPTEEAQRLSH